MKNRYIINFNQVVCKDDFGSIILYNLEKDDASNISEGTLQLLEFLQSPKTNDEIFGFIDKNDIEDGALQKLIEAGLVISTKSKTEKVDLFDTSKIKKRSLLGKRNFPSKIGFYLTNACNFRCRHCVFSAGLPHPLELSDEDWMNILEDAIDNKFDILQLSGGEPLIRKALVKRIVKKAQGKFNFIGINTNATLVDKDIAELLKDPSIVVYVSIYGTTKEKYKLITNSDLFDAFEKGVTLLIENGVNVRASVPLVKPMLLELDEIETYAKRLGINVISYIGLIPRGRGADNFNTLIPHAWSTDYLNTIEKYCQKSEEMLVQEQAIETRGKRNPSKSNFPTINGTVIDIPCHLMEKRMFVFPDGHVLPCEFLPVHMGNMKHDKIKDILKSSDSNYIFEELDADSIRFCNKCAYRYTCKAICPSYSYSFTGDYKNPPLTCHRALEHFYKGQYDKPLVR